MRYAVSDSNDKPKDADQGEIQVEEGDVVVAATDGVFDNLFDQEILYIVEKGRKQVYIPFSTINAVCCSNVDAIASLTEDRKMYKC